MVRHYSRRNFLTLLLSLILCISVSSSSFAAGIILDTEDEITNILDKINNEYGTNIHILSESELAEYGITNAPAQSANFDELVELEETLRYIAEIQIPQFENSTQEATAVMTVALSGEVDFFSTTAGTVIATKNIDYATAGIEAYITKNTNGNTVWGRVVRSICYTDISQPISFMALNPTVTYANAGEVINWIGEGSYIAYINGTHYYLDSGTQNAMFYVNIYK